MTAKSFYSFCIFIGLNCIPCEIAISQIVDGSQGQQAGTRSSIPIVAERERIDDVQQVRKRITSKRWQIQDDSFIQFNDDDTYFLRMRTKSNWGECGVGLANFDRLGVWKLKWEQDHGMVHLENNDMLAVAVAKEHLFFTNAWTAAMPRVDQAEFGKELYQHNLTKHTVNVGSLENELYTQLANTKWRKSNRFDLFMYPTSVCFDSAGRYIAEYRDGDCSAEGHWSLEGQGTKLSSCPENNACDLRGISASITSGPEAPLFVDNMVVFHGAAYVPDSARHDENVFFHDLVDMRVIGKYRGNLEQAKKTKIELTVFAPTVSTLSNVKVTSQRLVAADQCYTADGELSMIGKSQIEQSVTVGTPNYFPIEITPSISGIVWLSFEVEYQSKEQTKQTRLGVITEVK